MILKYFSKEFSQFRCEVFSINSKKLNKKTPQSLSLTNPFPKFYFNFQFCINILTNASIYINKHLIIIKPLINFNNNLNIILFQMSKKLFVLFTQLGKLPPKLYKMKKTVEKLIVQHPQYQVREYDNETMASNAKVIYQMEHERFLLREKGELVDKRLNELKGENLEKEQKKQEVGKVTFGLKEKKKEESKLIFRDNPLLKQPQQQPDIIPPRTLKELQAIKQSLLTLTPIMPRLLHYYTPTVTYQPIRPSLIYTGYFDGCSKFNPGPSGAGYYLSFQQKIILEACWPLGKKTNNQAELSALLYLLVDSYVNGIRKINFFGDSKLTVGVASGTMKASNLNIVDYAEAVKKILELFSYKKLVYVERKYNTRADKLSNDGVKKRLQVEKIVEKFGQFAQLSNPSLEQTVRNQKENQS